MPKERRDDELMKLIEDIRDGRLIGALTLMLKKIHKLEDVNDISTKLAEKKNAVAEPVVKNAWLNKVS